MDVVPDPYESNNTLRTATYIGATITTNISLSISPPGNTAFGIPGDEDWFRFVAMETGVLDFQLYFTQIDALAKAIAAYRIDMGQFPPSEPGLRALVEPSTDPRWRGPYLNSGATGSGGSGRAAIPLDPWGMPYQYRVPSQQPGKDYELFSFGHDRVAGGSGDDADIQL